MWFSSIIRMASATGVSRPTGTMVRVMTSALSRASPAFGGICRAAILASMSCSGRSECRAPGQFAAFRSLKDGGARCRDSIYQRRTGPQST